MKNTAQNTNDYDAIDANIIVVIGIVLSLIGLSGVLYYIFVLYPDSCSTAYVSRSFGYSRTVLYIKNESVFILKTTLTIVSFAASIISAVAIFKKQRFGWISIMVGLLIFAWCVLLL